MFGSQDLHNTWGYISLMYSHCLLLTGPYLHTSVLTSQVPVTYIYKNWTKILLCLKGVEQSADTLLTAILGIDMIIKGSLTINFAYGYAIQTTLSTLLVMKTEYPRSTWSLCWLLMAKPLASLWRCRRNGALYSISMDFNYRRRISTEI